MGRLRNVYVTAAAAAVALGFSATTARADEPSYNDLKQEVELLKTRLNQVENKQQETITTRDVDATIERVLKDADQRSQMLQMEGFTAGYNKGRFTIQDAAGNWVLRPNFQLQIRGVYNWREDGKQGGTADDGEAGLEIRRMKFGFDGNAFSPKLQYYFLWASGSTNFTDGSSSSVSVNSPNLEQAWIKYLINDDFAVRAGQIRSPIAHEMDTSSSKQLAADRSLANALIFGTSESFVQSVSLIYDQKDGPILAEFGVGDGWSTGNTDFTDPNEGGNTNWGVFGRVNYFVQGTRAQYSDFTAKGNKNDLLVFGAGGDITQVGDVDSFRYTVDGQWENTTGLGVYGAFIGNFIDNKSAGVDDQFNNWGFIVQAGYMVNDEWEPFARWDYTRFDDSFASSGEEEFCEITLGVNWYVFGGHNGKFTADATYLPNGSPSNQKGLGILDGTNPEYLLRLQFQLLL